MTTDAERLAEKTTLCDIYRDAAMRLRRDLAEARRELAEARRRATEYRDAYSEAFLDGYSGALSLPWENAKGDSQSPTKNL